MGATVEVPNDYGREIFEKVHHKYVIYLGIMIMNAVTTWIFVAQCRTAHPGLWRLGVAFIALPIIANTIFIAFATYKEFKTDLDFSIWVENHTPTFILVCLLGAVDGDFL